MSTTISSVIWHNESATHWQAEITDVTLPFASDIDRHNGLYIAQLYIYNDHPEDAREVGTRWDDYARRTFATVIEAMAWAEGRMGL